MNAGSNQIPDVYQNVFKQHHSSIYGILNHESFENTNLPINPNLLNFNNPILEQKFNLTLYCNRHNKHKLSNEFKNNLLVFYLFLTIYIAILASF